MGKIMFYPKPEKSEKPKPEFIRLWAKKGSRFTEYKDFVSPLTLDTRNFIKDITIKTLRGEGDTNIVKTFEGYNENGKYRHHLMTYIDNIHLTIFNDTKFEEENHITIAFIDDSRFAGYFNLKEFTIVNKMESKKDPPPQGSIATILEKHKISHYPIIEKLMYTIYNDDNIQQWLRKDSDPKDNSLLFRQPSLDMQETQQPFYPDYEQDELDDLPSPKKQEPIVTRNNSSRLRGRES